MRSLYLPFILLTYFGIWKPTDWTSKWKCRLYNLLSIVVLLTMYTFVATELIQVVLYISKFEEITETLFLLLTTSSVCYKALAFLTQRKNIIFLGDMLLKDWCIPKNADEMDIQKKFDDINRNVTATCMVMVYSNILTMIAIPLLQDTGEPYLPFKTWLPYDLRHRLNYWLSFVHQSLGLLVCSSISIANDNIVTGFMMQACAQFEILECRLKALPRIVEAAVRSKIPDCQLKRYERKMLSQHIRHHAHIFSYINEVMRIFSSVILVQFCASSTVITVSIFQLSVKDPGNLDFLMVSVYLVCMLTEFFLYCWFGNEVTLKSIRFAVNIYESEWTLLNIKSWKMILFIVHRTTKPIIISCYNFIVLSLDTYVNILRISYSVFNLLRSSTVT